MQNTFLHGHTEEMMVNYQRFPVYILVILSLPRKRNRLISKKKGLKGYNNSGQQQQSQRHTLKSKEGHPRKEV
jgi:hypothetical protein